MVSAGFNSNSRGFSLVEVLVSMAILTAVSLGVAQLFAASTGSNLVARGQTSAVALAEQKIEQLRSLTWGFDVEGQGIPMSDTSTNLAVTPPTPTGGGLNPSPANSLRENTAGYVDFLDAAGRWVGTGATPPPTAVYVRRWSIQPLPTNPNNTLILQVMVTHVLRDTSGADVASRGDATLVSVRTRKANDPPAQ